MSCFAVMVFIGRLCFWRSWRALLQHQSFTVAARFWKGKSQDWNQARPLSQVQKLRGSLNSLRATLERPDRSRLPVMPQSKQRMSVKLTSVMPMLSVLWWALSYALPEIDQIFSLWSRNWAALWVVQLWLQSPDFDWWLVIWEPQVTFGYRSFRDTNWRQVEKLWALLGHWDLQPLWLEWQQAASLLNKLRSSYFEWWVSRSKQQDTAFGKLQLRREWAALYDLSFVWWDLPASLHWIS